MNPISTETSSDADASAAAAREAAHRESPREPREHLASGFPRRREQRHCGARGEVGRIAQRSDRHQRCHHHQEEDGARRRASSGSDIPAASSTPRRRPAPFGSAGPRPPDANIANPSRKAASAQNQSIASSRVALLLVAAPGDAPLTLSLSLAMPPCPFQKVLRGRGVESHSWVIPVPLRGTPRFPPWGVGDRPRRTYLPRPMSLAVRRGLTLNANFETGGRSCPRSPAGFSPTSAPS